ncbi:MAG TPA: SIS domain-containing protein [Spirochaetota bacterium]|nr:SIS domain-containing protein [Spirochaetota bacterium]
MTNIQELLQASLAVKESLLADEVVQTGMERAVAIMTGALCSGGRVLFCGNGGSAADAQHFAAELSGKFLLDRRALDAEALHVNTSFLTAYANDFSYDQVYARLVQAKGRKGDVLIGISTSGNSKNIVLAFEEAHRIGMQTIGMTGAGGGAMAAVSDVLLAMPSNETPRIQECHLVVGHILCQLVEAACCGGGA